MTSAPVPEPGARMARLEGSARVLAVIKLANVALAMLAGFATTYVFVRALPLPEFRAFLLLVAFANFTVSAELGITTIVYSRLRRFWLGDQGSANPGRFREEELGVLLMGFIILILAANLVVAALLGSGVIPTGLPLLFIAFFFLSCLNLLVMFVKRALAAIDRNLWWEALDFVRRLIGLALLLAILAGLDPLLSIMLQTFVLILALGGGIIVLHRRLAMRPGNWLSPRIGGGHVRTHYLRAFGQSALLTISEIIAYNAPYFTIALATRDARAMLIFDFIFKMSRALSLTVRAMIEAALPRLTAAFYDHRADRFRQLLWRALGVALCTALAASAGLALFGKLLFRQLFAGKAMIGGWEIMMLIMMLIALSVICVSVFVQGALGRFNRLLRQSIPFLAASLLSVPLAWAVARTTGQGDAGFADAFVLFYMLTFMGTALLHIGSLRHLVADMGKPA